MTDTNPKYPELVAYSEHGHLLLAVTLSTKIHPTPEGLKFSSTEHFLSLWNKHLLEEFASLLPSSKSYLVESWFSLHKNPSIHFHGIIVIPKQYSHRAWNNGIPRKRLVRTLSSWKTNKKGIRPTSVCQYHISRIANTPEEAETSKYNSWGAEAISAWMAYSARQDH